MSDIFALAHRNQFFGTGGVNGHGGAEIALGRTHADGDREAL